MQKNIDYRYIPSIEWPKDLVPKWDFNLENPIFDSYNKKERYDDEGTKYSWSG